jgi:hypothetical protein
MSRTNLLQSLHESTIPTHSIMLYYLITELWHLNADADTKVMTMAGYNLTRSSEELLERNKSSPPSFAVHLYAEHWTLNNGIKFLYNNQVAVCGTTISKQSCV